jgi:hypothetical protein
MIYLQRVSITILAFVGVLVAGTAAAQSRPAPTLGKNTPEAKALQSFGTADSGPYSERNQSLAQAVCTALSPKVGWVFAVPRECSDQVASCADICKSLSGKDAQATHLACFNSIHIYDNKPASKISSLGLKTFKYNSCAGAFCGPNYCCCGGDS